VIFSLGTNPQKRLSDELSRLSPIAKYELAGTITSPATTFLIEHFPLRLFRKLFLHGAATWVRKIVEHWVVRILVIYVRFVEPDSISINNTTVNFQAVTGLSNQSLDQSLTEVRRIPEDDNVTMPWILIRQQMLAERTGWGIGQLVHQEMVADEKGVLHGAGWDYKCLCQRRCPK
jgi:hypothetical protein